MRGVRTVVAGFVLVGTLIPGTAWADGCAPSTDRARFALADVVFDGTAHPASSAATPSLRQDAVTFSVRQWHKSPQGGPPATVTLARLPEVPRAGEVWRVHATERPDGSLVAATCSGTHALASLREPLPFAAPGGGFTAALALAAGSLAAFRRRRRGRWLAPLAA